MSDNTIPKWQSLSHLQQLPVGWEYKTLGEISLSSQYGINSTDTIEGSKYPVLRMNNLKDGKIDLSDLAYISLSKQELNKYALEINDLLVNRTNSYELVGKTALFNFDQDIIFASYLVRFKLNDELVDPNFVNYYFNSYRAKHYLKVLSTKGVSQANLNPTVLKKQFWIPCPPIPEQQKIVKIISDWDEAIRLTRELIAAKQQRKKGLMQRLLTGQVRFPEFGERPWREIKLGKVFKERKERGFDDLPLLSITSDEGIIYRDELDRRDTSNSDKSRYLRVCPGDIGYNTMRMWQGVSAVSELEGIVSPAYTVCIPNTKRIDVNFIGYLFKFEATIYQFWRYSQGLVSDTLNLKFSNFAEIKVSIPELDEQRRIVAVLQACDHEIDLLEQKLHALQQQKKGLMQRLLTGQVRVQV